MLKVLYYNYYLFYHKILGEANPHMVAVLAFSFAESLLLNLILNIIEIYFFCLDFANKWQGISICAILIILNVKYYIRDGRGEVIVKKSPNILNKAFSIFLTLFFTAASIYVLFNSADWEMALLEQCRGN
jgi:hypothetical protein